MSASPVDSFKAKKVHRVLAELAAVRARILKGEEAAYPRLSVSLSNGQHFTGWLLSLAEGGSDSGAVLMQLAQDNRGPQVDVACFDAQQIVSLVVYDAVVADKAILS